MKAGSQTSFPRRAAGLVAAAVLVFAAGASGAVAAPKQRPVDGIDGPHLLLMDACASSDRSFFEMSLWLLGESRPSSLRTTTIYSPGILAPFEDEHGEVAVRGAALGGSRVKFSSEGDAEAGTLTVILNTEGRRPVPPLPVGEIARLRLRLQPMAPANAALRVDLEAGDTLSLDGNGRQTFTAVVGPTYVWAGRSGPGISVEGTGKEIRLEARGELVRDRAWILRGRLGGVRRLGREVDLGQLENLSGADGGMTAEDGQLPAAGDAFFYIVAQPDSAGRPIAGFGTDCIARLVPE